MLSPHSGFGGRLARVTLNDASPQRRRIDGTRQWYFDGWRRQHEWGHGGSHRVPSGGSPASGGGSPVTTAGAPGALPALNVVGNKLQDPSGKTVLRGSSLIDIGALYRTGGNNIKGVTNRMDKIAAAGVQNRVVRMPVYPKIDYNGDWPCCSP